MPILATVRLYCIRQLAVFAFCPFTHTFIRSPVNAGIQETIPSIITPLFRSTWNQSGNCGPILATVRLYCIIQLAVFDCCPSILTSSRQGNARIQGMLPSDTTL
jgi:hypothetical protein